MSDDPYSANSSTVSGRPWTLPLGVAFAVLLVAGWVGISNFFNWPESSGNRGLGIWLAVVGWVAWFMVLRFAFAKYRGVPDTSLADAAPYARFWKALSPGTRRFVTRVVTRFVLVMVIAFALFLLTARVP